MTMTFATFQSTRQECADLGEKLKDGHWEALKPSAGYVYLDQLFIERVQEDWPEEARREGQFYLQIENMEYFANALDLLECRLYVWAVDNGYCDVGEVKPSS